MAAINSVRLLEREEILRRLARMTGEPFKNRPNEVTKLDLAKWVGVEERRIRLHTTLKEPISDMWQLIYSQFFAMMDSGELVIQYIGDPNDRRTMKKTLVRIAKPKEPPRAPIRPRVDFTADTPKLKFE